MAFRIEWENKDQLHLPYISLHIALKQALEKMEKSCGEGGCAVEENSNKRQSSRYAVPFPTCGFQESSRMDVDDFEYRVTHPFWLMIYSSP